MKLKINSRAVFLVIFCFSLQAMEPQGANSQQEPPAELVPFANPVVQTREPNFLETTLSRARAAAHLVGGVGRASLNAPSIVKLAKEIKNVTTPAIKRNLHVLEAESVKIMITESNKVIFTSFLVANLIQTIFGSMIQSMDIGSIFTHSSEVSKSLGILFS